MSFRIGFVTEFTKGFYMALFIDEFEQRLNSGNLRQGQLNICTICHKPIEDTRPGEREMIDDTFVHADCYFNKLGEIVEQIPVGADSDIHE